MRPDEGKERRAARPRGVRAFKALCSPQPSLVVSHPPPRGKRPWAPPPLWRPGHPGNVQTSKFKTTVHSCCSGPSHPLAGTGWTTTWGSMRISRSRPARWCVSREWFNPSSTRRAPQGLSWRHD